MTISSVRTNLVKFCPKKNLTSNGSKPIRVLTCTKSSCSDERLPLGYMLHDFQLHRSNFFVHFLHFTSSITRQEGGRHRGNRAHRTFVPVSSSSNNCLHPCYLLLKSQSILSDFFLAYEQRLHLEKAF